MFRPIRKVKNAISRQAALQLLHSARRGVLALNGDDGYPYAIPINFYFNETDMTICFHGARAGHKVDAMKARDKVCFTVLGEEEVRCPEEAWAPHVKSVVVFGRCHPVEDPEEFHTLLKTFAMKYYPTEQMVDDEIRASGAHAAMYKIRIEHFSGKEVQEN